MSIVMDGTSMISEADATVRQHPSPGSVNDTSVSRMFVLQKALHAAKLALSLEKSGDTVSAASYFADSANELKALTNLTSLNEAQRTALHKFINAYQQRAHQLTTSGSFVSAAGASLAHIDGIDTELRVLRIVPEGRDPLEPSAVPFNPDTPDGCPPKEIVSRASWLSRLLRFILSDGGFIVPTIYVPSALWLRGCGTKLNYVQLKVDLLLSLKDRLAALEAVPPEHSRTFLSEIEETVQLAGQVHKQLYAHFAFVGAPPSEKGAEKKSLMSRIGTVIGNAAAKTTGFSGRSTEQLMKDYMDACVAVCDGFQFMPSRLSVFIRDESAVFKMQKLAEFMIKVVAGVILSDLHLQLERYMAKGRKNATDIGSDN
jgi:hypothetical protein